jgi:bifunctional ADP-heptose synthase (sugar kinase/adenylyltransferase)
MDTRAKIVDLAAATAIAAGLRREGARLKLVAGYFDVLTPDHVRRFRSLMDGQRLMAVIVDPPDSLLPPRARAELAASLSMVDYVLLPNGAGLEKALEQIRPDEVVREEMADARRSRALIEHVHQRQRG